MIDGALLAGEEGVHDAGGVVAHLGGVEDLVLDLNGAHFIKLYNLFLLLLHLIVLEYNRQFAFLNNLRLRPIHPRLNQTLLIRRLINLRLLSPLLQTQLIVLILTLGELIQ